MPKRKKIKNAITTCYECGKEYDMNEVVRINGDVWWKHKWCCAYCHTKAVLK